MQNVHAHVWDQQLHFAPETVKEADISRGYSIDLSVRLPEIRADMTAFDKVIVFGMKARLNGYWVPDEYVADYVAQMPDKLVGFAGCDPTQPSYMEEVRYGIEALHLAGVKMGPIYAGFDPRDERCDRVYSYCQERGIPIMTHVGTTYNSKAPLGLSRPWLWDEVAIKYPGLRLVLAHVGHPFCEECLVVIRKHPYLFADISALYYRPWQFYNMLIAAQEYKVTHKLLFGTDYPFAKATESIDGLRGVNQMLTGTALPRVSEQTIEGILNRDSFTLLGIKSAQE
jgi:uncharacterized protein